MNSFDKKKLDALSKLDKSRKGSIDKKIKKICELINSHKDYFTTSSCSGRILLIKVDDENRKNNSEWLFTSHELVKEKDLVSALEGKEGNIWFKQEPMILHVCCRDVDLGDKLWKLAMGAGYKRGGLTKGKNWYILEILSSEFIEAPLEGVSKDYIKILIKEGNKRMKQSFSRMQKFEETLINL